MFFLNTIEENLWEKKGSEEYILEMGSNLPQSWPLSFLCIVCWYLDASGITHMLYLEGVISH